MTGPYKVEPFKQSNGIAWDIIAPEGGVLAGFMSKEKADSWAGTLNAAYAAGQAASAAELETARAQVAEMRKALADADWLLDANRSPPPRLTRFKWEWQIRARALFSPTAAHLGEKADG